MKHSKLAIGLIIVLILAGAILAILKSNKTTTCSVNYKHDLTINVNHQTINAEAAINGDQQTRGLGGRTCIQPNEGMLFIFNKEGTYPFWMKDMLFPIDIIWINKEHKVVHVAYSVQPSTYPQSFSNDQPAQYVLEIKDGQANKIRIKYGSTIEF
jgi:uncharacterized membrane protein (UPF0127 family)